MKRILPILSVSVTLLLNGCGYHLGPDAAKPAQLQNIRTLAVPTFQNDTYEPRVAVLLATALINQLQEDGAYRVVSDEKADAILYCKLAQVRRSQARAVLRNTLASREFILRLTIDYQLIDRVNGEEILAGTVAASTSFFINADLQTDERQAISTAVQQAAVDLTGRLTDGF